MNFVVPSWRVSIVSAVPSPCGYGHLQTAVGQHCWLGSQAAEEEPAVPLVVPATEVLPPALVVAPAPPALVVAPAPVVPPVELRLSSPLPPHAEAKAAAPESTNTAAHKFDFEVV